MLWDDVEMGIDGDFLGGRRVFSNAHWLGMGGFWA
jgi:hypothetical protein